MSRKIWLKSIWGFSVLLISGLAILYYVEATAPNISQLHKAVVVTSLWGVVLFLVSFGELDRWLANSTFRLYHKWAYLSERKNLAIIWLVVAVAVALLNLATILWG